MQTRLIMESKPKIFIVSAHAENQPKFKRPALLTKAFVLKISLALASVLGIAGILSHERFDAKTATRATVNVNAVVYENGKGILVKSIGARISADGLIVTNFQNVGDIRNVWVQNPVGRTMDAAIVATDSGTGLALLKTEGRDLPFVRLAGAGALSHGATVHAIVGDGGLNFSCQSGMVVGLTSPTGKHRLQTDIPFQPSRNGSPLFDGRGQLVGLISASFAESHSSAVPVSSAQELLEKYFSENEVTTRKEAVLNNK